MFNNKSILVIGGTGSFGKFFIKNIIKNFKPKRIVVFSRDEMKQWNMSNEIKTSLVTYVLGDVRDLNSLNSACKGVDYIVHAAATKIVPTAETNPQECIKTNVLGAMNVIEAAFSNNVKKVVALSTDKAANPINLYGASKLCSDKLFVSTVLKSDILKNSCKFSVVRYGNVVNSRGSVIPFFLQQKNTNVLTVTDKNMTRFFLTLEDALKCVIYAFKNMIGGEIFVKKCPSLKIFDLARFIAPNAKIKIIGIRPGEKINETMITQDDSISTYEYKDYYKIIPSISPRKNNLKRIKGGIKVKSGFNYTSNNNDFWITKDQLKKFI